MEITNLTKELVKIPSPSGREKEIANYLIKRLKKNFKVKIQKVGNRFNILATIGNPNILLTTHLDTVPKQLEVKEDKYYIYGRGACDAKGIIASIICAAEKAAKQNIKNFGILFDVSEESDFSGIKRAINLVNPEFVVIGEPTDFKKVIGQKGLLGTKIKCYGKSAPGSMPEKGDSAIEKLIQILNKIKKIKLPNDKILGKTTINIGQIKGGIAPNVVPDYAEAIIEFRTTVTNEDIIKKILENIEQENIEILYNYEPVLFKNMKGIIVPYFTEMYFWSKMAKTIIIGPGNPKLSHTNNEKIKKEDLNKAVKLYFNILNNYINNKSIGAIK